jgi:hypothetical protein
MSLPLLLATQNAQTTSDLTTVAAVRAFLQIPGSDDEQNAIIAALIKRATRLIAVWTSREFAPADGATRSFLCGRGGMIDLAPFDLRVATDIVFDTDTNGTATPLTTGDYRLGPVTSRDGTYQWVRLDRRWWQHRRRHHDEVVVSITGDWGFAQVPADIEDACIKTVGVWLKRDVSTFSRTFNLDESRTERPDALPASVVAILQPYRPVLVG